MPGGLLERVRTSNLGQGVAIQYRVRRKPSRVDLHGVTVEIDLAWPALIRENLYRGSYEREEAQVLAATLRPDDRYFEVGAAIGLLATAACRIVGDDRVTAVEANPEIVPVAVHTAAQNGFSPRIINAVLGANDKPTAFYLHDLFWQNSLVPSPDARRVEVPGRRFLDELEQAQATYLMVDIEGGEIELLDCELPASIRAICMEVHPAFVGHRSTSDLLLSLMHQGFLLDAHLSREGVVFLFRGCQ